MATSGLAVGVVADDLTGAADSSAPFADRGWQTTVWLGDAAARPARTPVLAAVVTDSRSADARGARFATANATRLMRGAGFDRLFLKVDSTVRGPIAAQVAGALDAWREAHPDAVAVVCPAYPTMGRTVVGGRVLVHGLAAELSVAGRDPVTPVATGDLLHLLPAARLATAGDGLLAVEGDTVILDARDDADLAAVAATVTRLGPRAIAVGSAIAVNSTFATAPDAAPVSWNAWVPGRRSAGSWSTPATSPWVPAVSGPTAA